ncbi:MAG: WecB/TagA/CpsF family glycosyltransferase [bacterium]
MSPYADTAELLGLPVLTGGREEIIEYLVQRVGADLSTQVLTINPEMVIAMQRDPQVAELLRRADAVVADGVGIQLAAKLLGVHAVQRYPGVELALDVLERLAGRRVYLLGSRPGVAEAAAANLRVRLPRVNIAGCHDGYFAAESDMDIASLIRDSAAEILIVGMGSPRQEQFIDSARLGCGAKLMVGVGGSLEVYAGVKERAPQWVQDSGMEWLHRAIQDPARLGRLGSLPRFINLVLREYVGKLNDQVC